MIKIKIFAFNPLQVNGFVLYDETKECILIDPACFFDYEQEELTRFIEQNNLNPKLVLNTHAHFDHLGGVAELINELGSTPQVALHPNDMPLWHAQGGAPFFGLQIDPGPEPTIELIDKELLYIGRYQFEVRHTPGHTPGHVVFYCLSEDVMFCGDVIFQFSIGRTDLPGGDYNTLIQSIRTKILILPDETRLLPGHGPETSVGVEKLNNPFLI